MSSRAISSLTKHLLENIASLKEQGVYKTERIICSKQSTRIILNDGQNVLNFCANNYLGLSSHPVVTRRAIETISNRGAGLSSVRFICGSQDIHKELEARLAKFHGREDAIAYISCFDANGGFFGALLNENDAIVSDELNHASIIDGIRLSKAKKLVYKHRDMSDLEEKLKQVSGKCNNIMIVTDGVFSMDGNVAPLQTICELAEKYCALTFVDDCHATGFFGETGRGTEEYCGVVGKIDIINSTLGKALGGGCGGYTTSNAAVVDWLRQKSRPYLFSNTLPPSVVGTSLAALDLVENDTSFLKSIQSNTQTFRKKMVEAGFTVLGDDHPICPVMMPDERTAIEFSDELLKKGIYVIGFTFPVVPKGKARIRVQLSASHSEEEVEKVIQAFIEVGKAMNVIS